MCSCTIILLCDYHFPRCGNGISFFVYGLHGCSDSQNRFWKGNLFRPSLPSMHSQMVYCISLCVWEVVTPLGTCTTNGQRERHYFVLWEPPPTHAQCHTHAVGTGTCVHHTLHVYTTCSCICTLFTDVCTLMADIHCSDLPFENTKQTTILQRMQFKLHKQYWKRWKLY